MNINIELSTKSINNAIKELENYRKSLVDKLQIAEDRLMDLGIKVARQEMGSLDDIGDVSYLVSFEKEFTNTRNGVKGLMVARDIQPFISTWVIDSDGTTKSAEVSPILMYEFGSGQYADNGVNKKVAGVGRGTFPNQTHAFESSWKWKDTNGYWHHSSGIEPTHPMYFAWVEMEQQIERVMKDVFKNG